MTDKLIMTTYEQKLACSTCKFTGNCSKAPHKGICPAKKGQHYPKITIKPTIDDYEMH